MLSKNQPPRKAVSKNFAINLKVGKVCSDSKTTP